MPYNNFPRQLLSDKEKTKEWCEQNLDAMAPYIAQYNNNLYINDRYKDIRNYQAYHGHFDPKDYEHVTDQYGTPFPARMTNYNIIAPKIDLLTSEELRRPMETKISSVNRDAVNRKQDFKVGLILDSLLGDIKKEINDVMGMEINQNNEDFEIPDDIEQFMRYTYKEAVEEVAEDGIEYLKQKYRWKEIFKNGFRDLLVLGKVFYRIEVKNGDPFVRRVDPRNIAFDSAIDTDYIDESQWVIEQRWLSVNEILDEFGEELTKEDVIELEKMRHISSGTELAHYNTSMEWLNYDSASGVRIRIIQGEWKSIRALKFKVSPNKYDPANPFRKAVADTYKARKGEQIETKYVDDIWEGTKIGGRIAVRCRRRPNQVRSVDDAGSTPLSYVGCTHNMSAGRVTSLVDVLKHIQVLYNVVMYHIELTLSRAGGKAVVYDVSQMPSNIGMDMQTVLYHIKNDGIIPINSRDEGADTARFNQFQQVDFTLSNSVQQLINLKLMLEQTAGQVCGISPQREGAVSQYEAVGNVQRTVIQSNLVTENWFFQHSQVKKRVVERVCNLMKICWAEGKRAGFILGDGAFKLLNILPEIALNDYGIFINEGGKDDAIKQSITQLSQAALQSGNLKLLDVIKVLKADTLVEAEHVLENGLKEMQQQAQIAQQQQQAVLQAQAQQAEAQRQHEINLRSIDAEAKINVARENAKGRIDVANIQADVEADMNADKLKTALQKESVKAEYDMEKEKNRIEKDKK
tara:strand:+ start:6754 stop:8988 length:2235 start_codon:yes stop_codon:yes gene_type:complete